MQYSIYNDNIIKTKSFIIKNLMKSSHFPSTIRPTPNCFKNFFIGELTKRKKPQFDSIITTDSINIKKNKTLNNFRYNTEGHKIKIKKFNPKSMNFPSLFNNKTEKKKYRERPYKYNIKLIKNNLQHKFNLCCKELNFPYKKPTLNNPNIINYNNFLIKNNNNFDTIQNSIKKRLFLKSFTKLHLLINKSQNDKKVND